MTLARGPLVCLLLILLAGAVGVWVGVPYSSGGGPIAL